MLYRGLKLTQEEVDVYVPGQTTHLMGYTSTSEEMQVAMDFATQGRDDGRVPLVFEIEFRGSAGLFKLSEGYSAYPNEAEILIQDGLQYFIKGHDEVTDENTGKQYHVVRLLYPAADGLKKEKKSSKHYMK